MSLSERLRGAKKYKITSDAEFFNDYSHCDHRPTAPTSSLKPVIMLKNIPNKVTTLCPFCGKSFVFDIVDDKLVLNVEESDEE